MKRRPVTLAVLLGLLLVTAGCGGGGVEGNADAEALEALTQLASEYERQQERYREALFAAESQVERQRAEGLDPEEAFVPRFLELEARHRGTDAGLVALWFVGQKASQYGDPASVEARGRLTVIERLGEHYVEHRDADACLRRLAHGVKFAEAERLLRTLAAQSPHPHVRAAARLELADWLNELAKVPRQREQARAALPETPQEHRAWRQRWLASLESLGEIDPQAARAEAKGVCREVIEEYADVRKVLRTVGGPAQVLLERSDREGPTYGELAERLLFAIEHLSVGAEAPEIAGVDADGTLFRLSDYRGRVVVLMFSANWCAPCKRMYPENRRLLEELADEPFAILGVQADEDLEVVRKSLESGEITWRVWWDGGDGPIADRWNVDSWPTVYVLDRAGVIRHQNLRGDELRSAVRELLDQ